MIVSTAEFWKPAFLIILRLMEKHHINLPSIEFSSLAVGFQTPGSLDSNIRLLLGSLIIKAANKLSGGSSLVLFEWSFLKFMG
jgi:hypothetical protein